MLFNQNLIEICSVKQQITYFQNWRVIQIAQ